VTTSLITARNYLASFLPGDVSDIQPWQSGSLPYLLIDAFDLAGLNVAGHDVVLAALKTETSRQTLHKMLLRLRSITGCRVLYVAPHLTSYERKRLLAERIEFVVPDSQLFAPSLAIDLREATSSAAPASEVLAFGPATQAVLLTLMLSDETTMPTLEAARYLGYTPMTASRANRELEAAGLVSVRRVGSRSTLALAGSRREVWERAKPLLRSPVSKKLHVTGASEPLTLAGETALAELTLLAHPSETVYAIGSNDWRSMRSEFTICAEADANTFGLEVWSYNPSLVEGQHTVDPLSLILSLQSEPDMRVQIVLEELENETWRRFGD